MKLVLPTEYEKLPAWQIRMAILHATSHVEDVLGMKEDDDGYEKALQKEAVKFLREGIEESLTPHMSDGDNPTTPKALDVFLNQPVFSVDGTFLKRLGDQFERNHYSRLIRSSVNTLANVFNSVALKLRPQSYAYEKGETKELTRKKDLNRMKRVFLDSAMMALLEPLFRVNPVTLEEFLEKGLEGKDLARGDVREEFARKIRDQILKDGFNGESLKKIF